MRIGIDLDDTVCNTTKLINDFAKAYAYDKNITVEDLFMNPNEVQEFYKVYLREILEEDSVKRDFVEVYPKLRENNELFIITARSNDFMEELFDMDTLTEAWLKRNDITYDGIFFNVYAEQKAMVCLKNNIDVLIDDDIKNYDALTKHGIKVILFDDRRRYPNVGLRAESWHEVLEILDN